MSWIPSSIAYQIHLRAFAAREPRNPIEAATEEEVGTSPLSYLTRNLDVVRTLGVTVLHLSPPFPMGKAFGAAAGARRAARDFLATDPEYGSPVEMKAFIRSAHIHGFKVILGIAPSLTSRDHPWVESHPTYYIPGPDGTPAPETAGTDTARLDFTQPGLRRAMADALDFWLSVLGLNEDGVIDGVDGFAVERPFAINDPSFWDEAIRDLKSRHLDRTLLFAASSDGIDRSAGLFDRGFDAAEDADFYGACSRLYGVDGSGQTCVTTLREPDPGDPFASTYRAYQKRGLAGAVEDVLMRCEARFAAAPDGPRFVRYSDHPDSGRGVFRFGDGAVLAINQLLFLSGHALPSLLSGQEFGALNRPAIQERFATFEDGKRVRRSDGSIDAAAGIELEGNVFAKGTRKRKGWYAFYRELIALRRNTPELTTGEFALIEAGEKCPEPQRTVVAFERRHNDQIVRSAVNLGPAPRELAHADLFQKRPLYGGLLNGALAPFTSVVVRST